MAAVNTTTTTTVTTSVSQGIQLSVESQASTQSVGNFVTDVTAQPYIAPQVIGFYAYNMRPGQRYHVFFDSVLVDQYCAPGNIPALSSSGTGAVSIDTSTADTVELTGTWGDPIYADSRGHAFGKFNVPAGMFRTGERVLQLADVDSIALGNDALTSKAAASFTASNLNVTKQAITLTTVNPVLSTVPVTNTVVSTSQSVVQTKIPDIVNVSAYYEPIAQGLTINTPQGEAGIYATSLDLYFKQKSQTSNNGVTTYLCEVNNGYPDGSRILPFSTVHLAYGDITTSTDGTVPTKFTYETPVFLSNGKEYAFIVRPDNGDPDYFVYSANLGDIDISSGIQVYSQPTVGTAFYGATMNEWTALQTEYIKFKLNRANFTSATGDAYFNNANTDYLSVYNITYANTSYDVLPGDKVYLSTNSDPSSVNTAVNGTLRYYDEVKGLFYIENSTANFTNNIVVQVHRFANASVAANNGPVNTATLIAYANTNTLYNPVINDIVGQFATITPAGTSLSWKYSGTSNTYQFESAENQITTGYEREFYDYERVVASVSNETSRMGGEKSMKIHSTLISDTPLLSPLIDTVRANALVIRNLVDYPQISYNEFYNSGPSRTKYISKIVTLAPGQDAQDIQIILSAHRPPGTDIKVYVKFLNGEDTDTIAQKTWTPLLNNSQNLYSDPSNPRDTREYTFTTYSYYNLVPTTGTITCANSSANVSGTGTLFGSEVDVGYYINMQANDVFQESARQIVAIGANNSLTLNAPFNGNYTSNSYYIVVPPTTAWMSQTANTKLTGTVSAYTTNNTIIGSGTNFTGELLPGNIISVGGNPQAIVSIANSTQLTVGTPALVNSSGANAYLISKQGITYINSTGALFTTFKQFQIKVILQSSDSSKVPILDDLRALALQL